MKIPFNVWRVLAIGLAAAVIAGAIAWHKGLFGAAAQKKRPENSIIILTPYRCSGTWVFDDPSVGLRREPFVAGTPELMDELVKDIPGAANGFRLLVSAQPFPGHAVKLVWRRGDRTGNWYYCEQYHKEGWLCPGLFKYYPEAPKELYAKAEPLPPAEKRNSP